MALAGALGDILTANKPAHFVATFDRVPSPLAKRTGHERAETTVEQIRNSVAP